MHIYKLIILNNEILLCLYMSDDVTLDLRLQAKYLRRGKVVAWRRRPKISQQDLDDYLI